MRILSSICATPQTRSTLKSCAANPAGKEVRRFIFSDANVRRQLNMIENMLDLVIPEFIKQGKRRLMVAFGCTGGRHRSVAMAEALHDRMKDKCSVLLEHRDLVSEADDIRTRFEPK